MNKHFPIPVSFLQACCVVLSLGLGAFAADRPNVLFIAIDDLNHSVGALGGHPKAYTPNIDRPAERGVLFTNAHCAAPGCNPSRTAILTGLFPTTTGVYVNHDDWRVMSSVRDTLTLPEAFRKQGYRSVGAGKIYHAHTIHPDGFAGFHDPTSWDAYFPSCNRQLPDESTPDSFPANENPGYYNGFFDWSSLDIDDDAMGDGQVVQWASEQLTESHEQPLFLAVGIYRPHIPWYTPKDYFDNYPPEKITLPEDTKEDLQDLPQAGRDMTRQGWHQWVTDHDHWEDAVQAYLASATFADAMVGRLLAAFDASPMRDNTIIVLWSDHGYHLGHKQHWEKFALWEQTTRVPLIISGPNIPQGARRQTSVSLVDLYPTLAELCQLRPPTKLDGESLVPFLKDPKATAERVALITHGRNNHAVRSQHWRYIHYADGAEELYDHRQDSQERHNLANHPEHADIIVQHRTHLPKAQAPDEGYRKKKSTPKKSGEQWAIVSLKGNQQLALHALDDSLGTLTLRSKTDTNGKPASIAVAPNGRNVYVALHTSNVIASYCLEDDATLTLLNESLIGHAASYVQVHPNGRYLVSSYYGSGKAALHQIREDGSLEHKAVQFLDVASHAHAAVWDHQGHHAFVPHTRPNTITQVRFDPQSERLLPSPNAQLEREANSGPRHLWFHPHCDVAYSSDEQGCSITSYHFDPRRSTLTKAETQSSLPPEGYAGEKKSTSDIEVHPSGRFVYIANRGHNSLAAFAIDPSDRTKLTLISHASTEAVPRSFNIAPNGKFIVAAGQQTGKLAVYRIQENGSLEHTSTLDAGKSPAWVQIVSKPADSN